MARRNLSPTSSSSSVTEKEPGSRSSISASPPTSTPPTSHADEASILSDAMKMESLVETQEDTSIVLAQSEAQATPQPAPAGEQLSEGRRSARSSRKSVTTYNVQILTGTAIHTPTKYLAKHHKNVLHGPLETVLKTNTATSPKRRLSKLVPEDINDPAEAQLASEVAQAAQRRTSSRVVDLRKEALRNLTAVGEAASSVAQRGQELLFGGKDNMQHALRRTRSAPQLTESRTAGAKGSPKRPRTSRGAPVDDSDEESEQEEVISKPKKQWMTQGLYVGQHREFDARLSESQNRAKRQRAKAKESRILPLPMFAGERLLSGDPRSQYRNFKLPFDTYNPLPRKVKVDGWVKLHKNRFIGDASALWKREKQDSSQCYCSVEEGCGEACHNRIMSYECDSTNCRLTPEQCGNRPFAQLKKRAKGNGYDYGVEVMETEDRGYGVRAMRTFEPHQIIVEYAGEIITQAECEDRMKKIYKKDKCYYLMSFDNKMIIDATRGTIARFVNHSCEPNCEMIKWTVSGEPRMALFAGARGIMTGEELTYDYNFDPFSQKNIQECRCGTRSCRGVLGPKPKHQSQNLASSLLAGTKRKIQEVFGSIKGSDSAPNSPKKRKLSSMASATLTKAKNALAEKAAASEKAEKAAAEHAAQMASREERAARRSTSVILSSKRSRILRKASRRSLPVIKSSRQTTVSFKNRTPSSAPRLGALKPINKASRLSTIAKRNISASNGKRHSLPKVPRTPRTPANPSESEDESASPSPNITPASLRSAARAASLSAANKNAAKKLYTQTKLPFKPLNFSKDATAKAPRRIDDGMGFPDSDDEIEVEGFSGDTTSSKRKGRQTKEPLRKTGAGVKKASKSGLKGMKRLGGTRVGVRGKRIDED
ncbi:hypothetical protein CC78DRAFT_543373 [Lojkania enalia]|uniref:SET domain-containing protein n=1 Tax=Lojkania enalia TaxID=147567 RepID=A0A9P4K9N4_9PLEO|nr:hypothetical protein CC78DRAFT_543373 [Didymosphaeria enalia]